MTTTVSASDFTLAAGAVQTQIGDSAIFVSSTSNLYGPSLTLAGTLAVSPDPALAGAGVIRGVEVAGYGSFFQDATIHVTQTGIVRVDTAGAAYAVGYGIYATSWSPRVVNDGLVRVASHSGATGIAQGTIEDQDPAPSVLNNGHVVVTSDQQAEGVSLQGGKFENHGQVEVTGTGAVTGVRFAQHDSSFINTGEIRVVDLSGGGQGVGVYFSSNITHTLLATPHDIGIWRNDGVIAADVALKIVQSTIMNAQVFENTGQMLGAVQADLGRQTLVNSGVIQGAVDLGGDNDVYDGHLGSASGMVAGGAGADSLAGGAMFDSLQGNMGDDTLDGGQGDDWVVGGKDNDSLSGGAGGDVVWGNLGNDTQDGGDGNDQVRGGQGDDSITGGAGNDFVSGDRGADTIAGGSGADTFHGSQDAGIDRVVDFNLAEGDRVQLDPGTTYALMQVGADTVLDMGGGHQMILVGVSMASLPPGWIFGT